MGYGELIHEEVIPMSRLPLTIETESKIRDVAHALWVDEGMPDGRAETHWLKAVEIVSAESAEAAPAPKRKVAAPKKAAAAVKKAAPRKRG